MKKFSDYLVESSMIKDIERELDSMSSDEIHAFGEYIYDEYFEYDVEVGDSIEDDGSTDLIDKKEVLRLIATMDITELRSVMDDLSISIDEAVSVKMDSSDLNKNKRKFMTKTLAQVKKEKRNRESYYRKNKNKRKAYYKKNKGKLKKYNKNYRDNVDSGKHAKKLRKKQ